MSDQRDQQKNGLGFETRDLGSKPIYGFLISLVLIGILIYYGLWGMFHMLDAYSRRHEGPVSPMVQAEQDTREPDAPRTNAKIQREFPEPRLEDNERTELAPFRYQEEQILNSYGWVDQNAGVARIPIQRAMDLIVQRGLPTAPQAGNVPLSPVNLAKAAAEASDTSNMPSNMANKPAAKAKGKKK